MYNASDFGFSIDGQLPQSVQEVTIMKVPPVKGSNVTKWNFSLNGEPFGQVWTFRNTRTETHRFHAKTLAGAYANFADYEAAETFMRGEM